jgi:DNA repair exonuclease SbcCD ATPase subunit
MRTPKIEIPPAHVRPRIPAIAEAVTEVEQLRQRLRTERQELVELEHGRDAAAEQDTAAQAAALRAGKPDPGRKAEAKAAKAIESKAPTITALERAVEDAEAELAAAVQEHTAKYREQLQDAAEAERAKARELLDGLMATLAERQEVLALRSWLAAPTHGFNPGKFTGGVAGLLRPNGEEFRIDELVTAVAAALDPPKPPPPTNPLLQPLQHVPR